MTGGIFHAVENFLIFLKGRRSRKLQRGKVVYQGGEGSADGVIGKGVGGVSPCFGR